MLAARRSYPPGWTASSTRMQGWPRRTTDVNPDNLSRRALLQALCAPLAAAGATEWIAILQAAETAHADARSQGDARLAFFNAVEAADVEAVAAQIIPT